MQTSAASVSEPPYHHPPSQAVKQPDPQPVYGPPIPEFKGNARPKIGPSRDPIVFKIQMDKNKLPFKELVDAQKHLDTDKDRHKIQPSGFILSEKFPGKEHLYCDPSQLDANGKFRKPKIIQEMEAAGFKLYDDYMRFKQTQQEKAAQQKEQAQAATIAALQAQVAKQQEMLNTVVQHLNAAPKAKSSMGY